jgi:hypothetical protein
MFGWFSPTCPCDPAAKPWIEERLRWLSVQFGIHILLERPIILPTSEFFPDDWDGSLESVRRMFQRVCQYMAVNPATVEVQLFTDRTVSSINALDPTRGFAAGTWQEGETPWHKGIVRIERSALDRPSDLVGIMAHELAHQRLLGEGRSEATAYDNELLTDLAAIYHGFGVFLANNPRKSTGDLSHWPGSKLCRPEYISEPMMGYALAHIAWFRDEDRPEWVKHLRWAPRAVFKQGLRYLQKTQDSTFRPVRFMRAGSIDREG